MTRLAKMAQLSRGSVNKIRERKKLQPTDEDLRLEKSALTFKATKEAFVKLGAKCDDAFIEGNEFSLPVFVMWNKGDAPLTRLLPDSPEPFAIELAEATDAGLRMLKGKKNLVGLHLTDLADGRLTDSGMAALKRHSRPGNCPPVGYAAFG